MMEAGLMQVINIVIGKVIDKKIIVQVEARLMQTMFAK